MGSSNSKTSRTNAGTHYYQGVTSAGKFCDKKNRPYEEDKATASALIKVLFDNKLVPDYLQNSYAGLRTILEATVPTARNRQGGHGQGAAVRNVPDHFVAYVLHVTAANIVFLVEAANA